MEASTSERQDSWKEAGVLRQLGVWEVIFQPRPVSPLQPRLCLFPLLYFVYATTWYFIICFLSYAPEVSELVH